MAIEIRPFGGDAEELAAFVTRHWQIQYKNDGYAPVLSRDYFRWMMPSFAAGDPSSIIAAYQGGTLLGVMPSDPLPIKLKGRPAITLAREYLTVHSERLRGGIGRMLREGLAARSREIGARFATGFVNSTGLVGKGRNFWNSMADRTIVLKRPRQWIRVLNGPKVSVAMYDYFDRVSAWVGGILGKPMGKRDYSGHVRPYRPTDLSACHRIFTDHMEGFDLAYRWDEKRLGHHLEFSGLPTTLVYDDSGGAITGFATCYVFEVNGRRAMRNAIIDMGAPQGMKFSQKVSLLSSTIAEARAQDAHLAIVLGPPVNSAAVLLAKRFVPVPTSYHLLLAVFDAEPALKNVRRPFAIFR